MWLVYFYYQPTINWCFGLAALNCGLDQIIFIQIYEVVIDCFKQLTPFIKHWVRYIGMHQTTMIYLLVIFLIGGFNHFLFSISYMGCHPSHWLIFLDMVKTTYHADIYIYIYIYYCRASHTGDAGRGRGRERERGMSSELANMTCWGSAAYLGAMLAQLGAMLAHLEAMLAYAYAHKVL